MGRLRGRREAKLVNRSRRTDTLAIYEISDLEDIDTSAYSSSISIERYGRESIRWKNQLALPCRRHAGLKMSPAGLRHQQPADGNGLHMHDRFVCAALTGRLSTTPATIYTHS